MAMTQSTRPVAFITGGTSGIGAACADAFAREGYIVYAASRHAEGSAQSVGKGEIRPLRLDVREVASVQEAAETALREAGKVDVLIHCAGIGIGGPAEDTPMEDAQRQLDVNYFGVLRVNQALLPAMREGGGGRVIIIGSVAGIFPIPYQSQYSASKFALETYAAALRIEAKAFGLRVSLIEPGDTKTGFTAARRNAAPENSPYREACARSVAKMERDELNGRAPSECAKVALRLARRKRPPLRNVVGWDYKLLVFARRLLPDSFVEWVLRAMYIPRG